jgi:hypothetical protein
MDTRREMDIIKTIAKKHDISYQNEFIDDIILNFDKRMLIIFFYLIHKFQQETNSIEVDVNELKKILDNKRREKEYIKKLIEKLYDTTIYYKNDEAITEDGRIKIGKNDYVKDHLFDVLVFPEDSDRLKFVIKKRYRKYFLNLQNNFTTTTIETLKNLNSTQILIYLQLSRWKNYFDDVEMNWEYFRINAGFSKGYRNGDVLIKLNEALERIYEETGMKISYEIIRSKNRREILKIIFKINETIRELKLMLQSEKELERKYAKQMLKIMEKEKNYRATEGTEGKVNEHE